MADTKISALTGATTPLAGTEVLPIVQSGTTKNVSVANLTAGRNVNMVDGTVSGLLKITGSLNNGFQGTGSVSGTVLTITAVSTGSLAVGDIVYSPNMQPGTVITSFGTGSGGTGTYNVSVSQTAATSSSTRGITYTGQNTLRIVSTDTTMNNNQPEGFIQFYGSDVSSPGAGISSYIASISESSSPESSLVFGTRSITAGIDANEVFKLDSAGNGTLKSGNLVIGTSGKGIDFSANSHASGMTSETLTWYEEGTWTPTSTTLTFGGSPTYTGHYVRIGRLVNINLRIQDSSITSSGAYISNGFPFVSASIMTTAPVANVSNNVLLGSGFITVSGGNTIIYLPNFTSLTDVSFSGFYFV